MNASSKFSESAAALGELWASHSLIRVVNFHNTPRVKAEQFERELAHYSRHFSSVNEDDLDQYLITGHWHKSKPGLIVVLYEGYRDGYDVLMPLLERHGFTGWFFIITGFVNASVADQLAFAQSHRIGMETREYPDGRYALTWEELRALDRRHVIASHARSHTQLSLLEPDILEREVIGAQEDFQRHLGHPVRSFASLRGPAHGEHAATDRLVEAAGYDFVFSNFLIQRIRSKEKS
ncbi:MAG: polysaccharide deacetylase family protein [Acidobacteriaceae bacterium]